MASDRHSSPRPPSTPSNPPSLDQRTIPDIPRLLAFRLRRPDGIGTAAHYVNLPMTSIWHASRID